MDKLLIVIIVCFGLLAGCTTPEYLPKEALQQYIREESNGLYQSRQVGPLQLEVSYRPNDFLVWQELEGEEADTSKVNEVFDRYNQYLFLLMQLSVGEKDALYGLSTNQAAFNDRLQTLSFRMNQYVNLTTSRKDTIPVADFYYSRMFGMSKSNDVLFVFNRSQVDSAQWVSFNVKEFGFKSGNQSFRFDLRDILNTPKLAEMVAISESSIIQTSSQ